MRKSFSILGISILLACGIQPSFSQTRYSDDPYYYNNFTVEIGGSLGMMNCLTDLGGGKGIGKKFIKDLNIGSTEPAGSIYFTGLYKNALALRAEMTWGIVRASDGVLKKVKETTGGRYERNLSFRSPIFELSLVTEIHPRYFKTYSLNEKLPTISPYLLGGIGYFTFNPRARLNGVWEDLRPLNTEGQGFEEYPDRKIYKLKQINFPVGGGLKFKLTDEINFSTEFVYRFLMTDYLDDVSTRYVNRSLFQKYFTGDQLTKVLALQDRQSELKTGQFANPNDIRGNPNNNDAYFSLNFKIGVVF
ncbi:hypothetical protein [Ferruginibacter sp.]